MKSWIARQIRDFAPITIIVVVGILTHKWWQPYLDSTASHSTVDRSETTSETTYKSVHLTLGNPSGASASVGNPDNYLMVKPQYALFYNRSKGTANWVSWQLNKSWLGHMDRQNDFRPDDTLPEGLTGYHFLDNVPAAARNMVDTQ